MTRALGLAVLLAGVIVVVGFVAYGRIFRAAPAGSPPGIVDRATRRIDAPARPAAADGTSKPPASVTARLAQTRGSVQVRTGKGEWHDAVVGEALGADDAVRAGPDAEAVLVAGDGVEVRLSPRSELALRELDETAARVLLEQGHVTANVDGSRRRLLRVQARGGDAVAESRGGQFGVVSDGTGRLAVATATGSVKLTAGGAAVDVAAGQSSLAGGGTAPTAPVSTPGSLFLKLGALAAARTNQPATTVQGETAPGALVRVGGATTAADVDGRFAIRVPLQDGRNELVVEVADAAGRASAQALPAVVVDRNKPALDAAVRWGR
jgi:hypothetical protein